MLFRHFLLLFGSFAVLSALRVKDNIRIQLTDYENNCMRLLNGTNQIGCQSGRDGNTGVVTLVKTADDIKKQLQVLPWGLDKLIALVNVKNLDSTLFDELKNNSNVVGVLLYHNKSDHTFKGYSEDASCPNREYSFYPKDEKYNWNRAALVPDGSMFTDYGKPVFVMQNLTEISLLIDQCYHSFNRPLDSSPTNNYRCVLRMKAFMHAAGDARLCQSRQKRSALFSQVPALCDELYDYNLIQMVPTVDASVSKANVLVVATRLDSISAIHKSKGGDTSVLVSLISALSVTRSIGQNRLAFERMSKKTKKQLMFAFFQLESLSYIGSTSFVYNMQHPESPKYKPERSAKWLQLEDLEAFVEIQQLSANHSDFYLHNDWEVAKEFGGEMDALLRSATDGCKKVKECNVHSLYDKPSSRLPPASYQTLLKARRLPGFLLAPFRDHYDTRTLNSFFDTQLGEQDPEKARSQILEDVEIAADIVMRVALNHVSNNDHEFAEKFSFDRDFAKTLIDCLIFDPKWNCSLIHSLGPRIVIPHSTYTAFGGLSPIRSVVESLLIYTLGDTDAALNIKNKQECEAKNKNQDLYSYRWQSDDAGIFHCYQTSLYKKLAISPAFDIEDYDLSNTTYPAWVESRWEHTELEVFLDAGYKFELHAFGLALMIVGLSILLYFFLNESWFVNPSDVLPADV
ncbi:Nicastrin [Aphelenchoides bicaudatus]|nr:Nicastrin [Aphelenchoides bicaudatus]